MKIFAKDYGKENNFSNPFIHAVSNMKNGDTLIFENKEYHFFKELSKSKVIHMTNTDSFKNPKKYFAMLIENLADITIDGNGAVFVIHGDICSLGILNCANVKLKNFTIRYYAPSNIEMHVKSINKNTVIYTIPKTTQWKVCKNQKSVEFYESSPLSDEKYWSVMNDGNSWNGVVHIGGNVFRIPNLSGPFGRVKSVNKISGSELEITYRKRTELIKDAVYTLSQNKNRNTCGVFVSESSNVSAENIEINYLQGFGWLSQMCQNISFRDCSFKPDCEHTVSSFADLIHICSCKGKVDIDGCFFSHPHDDAINIHGAFLRFKKVLDKNSAVFEFVHSQQGGYRAFHTGDKVRLYYRSSLAELGGVFTVKKAVDNIDKKTVALTFCEALPKEIKSRYLFQSNIIAENISYCPNVNISNCIFESIPTRGILCTTSGRVRIFGNSFSKILMPHIFISNDANDWYESGPVRDMEIFSNRFDKDFDKRYEKSDCAVILIEPVTLGGKIKSAVHKNIKIHSNVFNNGSAYPVKADGVENIGVYSNRVRGNSEIKLKHCTIQHN